MKLLLDAMMPEEIGSLLFEQAVSHAADLGWRHLENGELLDAAEGDGFDALITKDTNIRYQQNFAGRKVAVIVVRPRSQDIEDLLALAPLILDILPSLTPGSVRQVRID